MPPRDRLVTLRRRMPPRGDVDPAGSPTGYPARILICIEVSGGAARYAYQPVSECREYGKGIEMKLNEGSIDRVLRIVVGIALLSLVFILEGAVRWWGLLGLLPLITGAAGFCPAYALFGISTCPHKGKSA